MNKLYASFLIFFLSVGVMNAQVTLQVSDATATASGQTVDIDVVVSGFTDIISMQFSLNWDPTVYNYSSVANATDVLPEFTLDNNIGTPATGDALSDGQLTVSWNQSSTQSASIPDDTRLFTLRLFSAGDNCDMTSIVLSNTPRVIEVVNDDFDELDLTLNGGAINIDDGNGNCDMMGMDGVGLIIDDLSAPEGEKLCVPITTTDFNNIESVQMGIKWDPTVLAFDTEEGIKNAGLSPVNANTSRAATGELQVLWFFESTAVTLPDNETLFEVCFDVIGDTGDNTQIEIVDFPNASPPFEIEINSNNTVLDFFVDDATFTVGSGDGGEQTGVGFIIDDLYTGGATNFCVPITTMNFDSIVAFMSGISFDTDVLSYTGFNNVSLSNVNVADQNKDAGELRVLWTDQNANPVTIADGETLFELCFDVTGMDGDRSEIGFINIPPNFAIEAIEFPSAATDFFIEDGSVTVGDAPVPADSLQLNLSDVMFDMGDTVCVDFSVAGYTDIAGMSFVASWDESVLDYVGPRNINLPELTDGASNFSFVNPNSVRVLHTPSAAASVADGTTIFSLCFVAIPGCDSGASTEISVGSDSNVSLEFIDDNNQTVPVSINTATVSAEACQTVDPEVNLITLTNPSCPGNLDGAILVEFENLVGSVGCSWADSTGTEVTDNCNLVGQGAGAYTITATDENGTMAVETFTLTDPSQVDTSGINVTTCATPGEADGEIVITFTGGNGGYVITSVSQGSVSGLSITGLEAGDVTFMVEDAEGCEYMFSYAMMACPDTNGPVTECNDARTVISPNGDGMNDAFVIGCLNDPAVLGTINDLAVYNRWGELVFAADNYQNNWTGTDMNNDELDEGGYMWVFTIGGPTAREIYRGTVTILR